MGKCDFCGIDLAIPFNCSYCKCSFCSEHRLPEAHDCVNLIRAEKWKLHEGNSQPSPEIFRRLNVQEPRKSKLSSVLIIILIVSLVANAILVNQIYGGNVLTSLTEYFDRYDDGYEAGKISGYDEGYEEGIVDGAGRGYNIRDPTYDEAKKFIREDDTESMEYVEDEFVCHHFAATFKTNAFDAGFRCFYVHIELPDDKGHAIVAFDTIDQGLLFIEPQHDYIVTVEIGKPYTDLEKFAKPDYDDTVINYMLIP